MDDKYFTEDYQSEEETTSINKDDCKDNEAMNEPDEAHKLEENKYGISKPRRIIIKAKIIENAGC